MKLRSSKKKFIDPKRGTVAGPVAGRSAYQIAKLCGVDVPEDTKVIIAEYKGVGKSILYLLKSFLLYLPCIKLRVMKMPIRFVPTF